MFPPNVKFLSTPRWIAGGESKNPYDNFNLANHVGDKPSAVIANRQLLINHYNLPTEPKWLDQYHSNICVNVDSEYPIRADASFSETPGIVCAVMTADCLPIFLTRKDGSAVAVVHAGWRGLIAGVIESSVEKIATADQELLAHFGPAISQAAFKVGAEVFEAFVEKNLEFAKAFAPSNNKYRLDLYEAGRIVLQACGVSSITGGDVCTFSQKQRYYSYRRDGEKSGRMAHLIWMTQ